MNNTTKLLTSIAMVLMLLLAACAKPASTNDPISITGSDEKVLKVVATTNMLADLSRVIGGDKVSVSGLMGPGIDPHLYQASAGDVTLMQKSDVVVYNGLHLEGKMGEIFENLTGQGYTVICIGDGIDQSKLLEWEEEDSLHDPHIWFDVALWKQAAKIVADGLSKAASEHADHFKANYDSYAKALDETDTYIKKRVHEVPEPARVLVTAHDAFNYFGRAYGFEVRGLQGISTDAEAGTADVSDLATFIVERQIKAIFIESSVPHKTIEALQAAVKAKGFDVAIGGELYSDSLGDPGSGAETYIKTVKANIDTIVDALK